MRAILSDPGSLDGKDALKELEALTSNIEESRRMLADRFFEDCGEMSPDALTAHSLGIVGALGYALARAFSAALDILCDAQHVASGQPVRETAELVRRQAIRAAVSVLHRPMADWESTQAEGIIVVNVAADSTPYAIN